MEEELTCPVCLDLYQEPKTLPCSHSLCRGCVTRCTNVDKSLKCPVCRFFITGTQLNELKENKTLSNIVSAYQKEKEKFTLVPEMVCYRHPTEQLLLYCWTCKKPVCSECVTESHHQSSHRVDYVDHLIQDEKENVSQHVMDVEQQLEETKVMVNAKKRDLLLEKQVADVICSSLMDKLKVQLAKIKHDYSQKWDKAFNQLKAKEQSLELYFKRLDDMMKTSKSVKEVPNKQLYYKRLSELAKGMSSFSLSVSVNNCLQFNDNPLPKFSIQHVDDFVKTLTTLALEEENERLGKQFDPKEALHHPPTYFCFGSLPCSNEKNLFQTDRIESFARECKDTKNTKAKAVHISKRANFDPANESASTGFATPREILKTSRHQTALDAALKSNTLSSQDLSSNLVHVSELAPSVTSVSVADVPVRSTATRSEIFRSIFSSVLARNTLEDISVERTIATCQSTSSVLSNMSELASIVTSVSVADVPVRSTAFTSDGLSSFCNSILATRNTSFRSGDISVQRTIGTCQSMSSILGRMSGLATNVTSVLSGNITVPASEVLSRSASQRMKFSKLTNEPCNESASSTSVGNPSLACAAASKEVSAKLLTSDGCNGLSSVGSSSTAENLQGSSDNPVSFSNNKASSACEPMLVTEDMIIETDFTASAASRNVIEASAANSVSMHPVTSASSFLSFFAHPPVGVSSSASNMTSLPSKNTTSTWVSSAVPSSKPGVVDFQTSSGMSGSSLTRISVALGVSGSSGFVSTAGRSGPMFTVGDSGDTADRRRHTRRKACHRQ